MEAAGQVIRGVSVLWDNLLQHGFTICHQV